MVPHINDPCEKMCGPVKNKYRRRDAAMPSTTLAAVHKRLVPAAHLVSAQLDSIFF